MVEYGFLYKKCYVYNSMLFISLPLHFSFVGVSEFLPFTSVININNTKINFNLTHNVINSFLQLNTYLIYRCLQHTTPWAFETCMVNCFCVLEIV